MFPLGNKTKLSKSPLCVFHYLCLPFISWGCVTEPSLWGLPRPAHTVVYSRCTASSSGGLGSRPGPPCQAWVCFPYSLLGEVSVHGALFYFITSIRFFRCFIHRYTTVLGNKGKYIAVSLKGFPTFFITDPQHWVGISPPHSRPRD